MNWVNFIDRFIRGRQPQSSNLSPVPFSSRSVINVPEFGNWYHPVILGPNSLGTFAVNPACLRQVIQIIKNLESDDYTHYLLNYYHTGLERFGDAWRYADITTVLLAAAHLMKPESYLEIGVRRGRSMAMVAALCPDCEIVGFDMWVNNYAGMPNPGPDFVYKELGKLGYSGRVKLISGNSHESVPNYFKEHPDAFFDLVTVDGDHSEKGAEQDLRQVLTRLKVGGVVVFDDICHPAHPYLAKVWRRVVGTNAQFNTWEFTELGYGVALAVRREA